MKVGSLFSGIGGLDLGLERAGFEIAWMCEINPYAREVLAQHWQDITIHKDITKLMDPEPVDVLVGGFPCQDISNSGKRAGIDGEKSGLWKEYARLIGLLRPRYVVVENVGALTRRGLDRVLGDLAKMRYDAEWISLRASDFCAPHQRERLFLVSYPSSTTGWMEEHRGSRQVRQSPGASQSEVLRQKDWAASTEGVRANSTDVSAKLEVGGVFGEGAREKLYAIERDCAEHGQGRVWSTEPDVCRMVDGFPGRVDQIKALGNAVVPQVAQFVGECVKVHAIKAGVWKEH
jgi:DNA (cytosine-5)-methyltransferase 1